MAHSFSSQNGSGFSRGKRQSELFDEEENPDGV